MWTLVDTAYHSGPLGQGKRLETGHRAFPVCKSLLSNPHLLWGDFILLAWGWEYSSFGRVLA